MLSRHPHLVNFVLAFIFIVGIQPKTKKLDDNPRRCPRCGLHQAYNRRVDHYFSLFFIPLLRVKKGTPFVLCDRCGQGVAGTGGGAAGREAGESDVCRRCGRAVDASFRYCPHCGRKR